MKIGGYLRLSRDEDKEDYASILAQKDIVTHFVLDNKIKVDGEIKWYIDDNYTGYKFNRPGMN